MSSDDPIWLLEGPALEAELARRAEERKKLEEAEQIRREAERAAKPLPREMRRRKRCDSQVAKQRKPTNKEKRRRRSQNKK